MTLRKTLLGAAALIALAAPAAARAQNTAICHATGDPNTPYQQIEVPPEASVEHLQHADDIVPAPVGGCPAQVPVDEADPSYPLPEVTAQPEAAPAPQRPPRRRPRRPRPAPQAQAAPSISSGNLTATASVEGDTLPMTGAEIPLIALMGAGFLLAGSGLRLRLGAGSR